MLGHTNERIDIGSWTVDSKSVAAEKENLAAAALYDLLLDALLLAGPTNELFDDLLKVVEHLYSPRIALRRLEDVLGCQRFDQLIVKLVVFRRGRRFRNGGCDAPRGLLLLLHGVWGWAMESS